MKRKTFLLIMVIAFSLCLFILIGWFVRIKTIPHISYEECIRLWTARVHDVSVWFDVSDSIGVLEERPLWDDQVLDPEELFPGQILIAKHQSVEFEIVILSGAYIKTYIKKADCIFDYAHLPSEDSVFHHTGYCTDHGFVQYKPGWWNSYNYPEFSGKDPFTSEAYIKKGDCVFDYAYLPSKNSVFYHTGYCTDHGLLQYEHGWNRYNYLEFSDKDPFTLEEVQEILEMLEGPPGW